MEVLTPAGTQLPVSGGAIQELAEKVKEVVEPLRDQLDAVVVFPSMPEVMRLNKVGSFTMQNLGQSKSVVSEFMKKKKKVRCSRPHVSERRATIGLLSEVLTYRSGTPPDITVVDIVTFWLLNLLTWM